MAEKKENGEKKTSIRISVRNLVEFVMRSGDLDNRRTSGAEKDAMQAGSRIHRKIQKRMGADYQAEVTFRHQVDEGEFSLDIEGRADGVITEPGGVTIDEIKGVYRDLDRIEEPVAVHQAQAMCYGYFCCLERKLSGVAVQVTYCNLETEEIRRFRKEYDREQLEEWFFGLVHEYVKWARYLYEHGQKRDISLRELSFPFPYREGQKELAVSVYRAILRKRELFIQAPTGVGKTLSCLYPALKAMGEGLAEKVFYLTAKTITRSVAEESFGILRQRGMYLRFVTITAKEKLCFLDKPSCNPEDCPYAKGHFDRVNDAVYEIIHREFCITREVMLQYAKEYRVCPFEFCLDITNWADAVVCDYNYVFDPTVRLKRYFSEGVNGEYLFLVDEAHNLVSRGREMYSAVLYKEDVLLVKKLLKGRSSKAVKRLDKVNRLLLEMKRSGEGCQVYDNINALILACQSLFGEMETFLEEEREFSDRDQVLDFYFQLRNFLNTYEGMDEAYRIYSEMDGEGRFFVRLFCMDPAGHLKECLEKGRSTVFFSATLLPILYYKELLSGNREDYAVYAPSPFPRENRLVLVARDVSSRYSRRNRREYEKVADHIEAMIGGRNGNYMAFFPSYQYLEQVRQVWEERKAAQTGKAMPVLLCQDPHMREEDKEAFLAAFEEERESSMVAFCVLGGIFSEGIDLKADRLIGAAIVGTGLPMVCTEQELLKQYFDEKDQKGFDYAYQYPGMNKVMQSAGRVIRTMEDKGVILLLDDRFLREDCHALFPLEWLPYEVVDRWNAGERIRRFWKEAAR